MSEVLKLDNRCQCASRQGLAPDTECMRLRLLEMREGMAIVSCHDKQHRKVVHLIRVPVELVYGWV